MIFSTGTEFAFSSWHMRLLQHHGGEKPGGGGYGKPENKEPARKGGRKGGRS